MAQNGLHILKKNWKIYLIEAWALGMFMVSTCLFTILIEHPDFGVREAINSPFQRRMLTGVLMAITAILLIYSPWGKKSGAHMNPAFTLANWQMDRMSSWDAVYYILAQFIGGFLGVWIFQLLVPDYIASPVVSYAVTIPGNVQPAELIALLLEFFISFLLLLVVLLLSNYPRLSKYTGYVVGLLLFLYISLEAPYSGMSINPARTVASSLPSGIWTGTWLYFVGPVSGMISAGFVFRKMYRIKRGECRSMACFMSGNNNGNETYEVLKYKETSNNLSGRKSLTIQ